MKLIDAQILALQKLQHHFPDNFESVIHACAHIKGRIVFSGVGKSGYIARLLASTFSSTGHPAQFLDANAAAHGEIGLLTHNDLLIVLSRSGAADELVDVMQFGRQLSISVILMTSVENSLLARYATHILLLPVHRELCPFNMAPTTSVLMQLAMGNALAIALMHHSKITIEQYIQHHPAGSLGRRHLTVAQVMQEFIPCVRPDTLMGNVIVEMTAASFGFVAVMQNDELIGVISDGDLRRAMHVDLLQKQACDVMTRAPLSVMQKMNAYEAIRLMHDKKITFLFVTDENGKTVGTLRLQNALAKGLINV